MNAVDSRKSWRSDFTLRSSPRKRGSSSFFGTARVRVKGINRIVVPAARIYGDAKGLVRISDGAIIRGSLPRRQANLVKSWVALRQAELMENWRHAQTDGRCFRIAGPTDD